MGSYTHPASRFERPLSILPDSPSVGPGCVLFGSPWVVKAAENEYVSHSPVRLSIAEGPTKPRAGAIVAARQCWRRLIVPASVKRKIPREIAKELDVVGSVRIDMDAPRL